MLRYLPRESPARQSDVSPNKVSTAARGLVARMTSPITATPCAPAERHSGAFSAVMPPSAITGPDACATNVCETVETERRTVARFACSNKDRADGHVIGA